MTYPQHASTPPLPPEFVPLGEWVREHSVYNVMKQLPFFRTYMKHRFFRKWRAAARAQRFEKVRVSVCVCVGGLPVWL